MFDNVKELLKGWNTIPNWLSYIRIILVPVFAVLYCNGGDVQRIAALLILAVSGLTDFFDGKIARRFNQVSDLGKMLDPVADKITQITLAVVFYITFSKSSDVTVKAFSWVFLVFVIKEVVQVIFGAIIISLGLRPSAAAIYGKAATMVFYIVMILLMLFAPDIGVFKNFWAIPGTAMIILVAIAAVMTIVAFASYVPGAAKQILGKSDDAKAVKEKKKK